MTIAALYVGGPLDGQMREHPDDRNERVVTHSTGLNMAALEPMERFGYISRTLYTKRMLRFGDGDTLPVSLYAMAHMTDKELFERLIEYYRPVQE